MIGSVWAFHSGQICTAPTRAIVHRSVYDQVVGGLAKMAGVLKVGDPLEKDTVMGPLITEAHLNRVEGYVASGKGARAARSWPAAAARRTWRRAGTSSRR